MKIVVVYNMKGGIGKTTNAVTLAETLASMYGLRVLLADADLQRSTSLRLCSQQMIDACSRPGKERNIGKYFLDAVGKNALPDVQGYITERCGTVHGHGQVDLLMGSFDTLAAENHITGKKMVVGERTLMKTLMDAYRHLATGNEYDVLIVDTPPSPGTLVQAALGAADLLIVPMVPQGISFMMFGAAQKHLQQELQALNVRLPDTLVLATQYEASAGGWLDRMRMLFSSQLKVRKNKRFGECELFSPEHGRTLREKYGPVDSDLKALGGVVLDRLGLRARKAVQVKTVLKGSSKNVRTRRGDSAGAAARTH
jgi:chromosome partitioning protein